MNRDNHLIFEGYRQQKHLTPKESLQRDKEFFNYVIESNSHLSSLKEFSTKKLFNSYISTLAYRINSSNPGLIRESNMSDTEAFSILNEATQTVSNQDAYYAVKDIFEEIAVKQLIRKADLFLEQDVIVNTQGGKKKVGYLTGKPVAAGSTQVTTYGDNKTTAYPNDQIQQIGPDEQQQHKLDKRPATYQRMKGLRSANKELTKANQENAARIAELQAKIQEMEAAEANMAPEQKAQSDATQAQMLQIIQNLSANQGAGNQGAGNQAGQNPPAAQAANPGAAAPGSPKPGAPKPGAPKPGSPEAAAAAAQKNPGLLSKLGSAAKKYLLNPNTLGMLGGAAGGLLGGGPLGSAIGGALGKGLGKAFGTKGGLGNKIKAGLGGAATGGLMGAGLNALTGGLGGGNTGDMYMPADNASSVLSRPNDEIPLGGSPEEGAIDYSDTEDANSSETGAQDQDAIDYSDTEDANSSEYGAQDTDPGNPYGAEYGAGLPAGGETQEGDDTPAQKQYKTVDNRKGAQRQMALSRGNR